jgi:FKBP-type peptidyl-prolyl cis-trans isomerase 2
VSLTTHKVLFVDYVVRTLDGDLVDESEAGDPLEVHLGVGAVVEGFENAVSELGVGDEADFEVPPEQGYGVRDETMVQEIPRTEFPADMVPEPGMVFGIEDGDGQASQFVVAKVTDEVVVCDFNHPLADQTLRFHVKVQRVEEHEAADCDFHQHTEGCTHCH